MFYGGIGPLIHYSRNRSQSPSVATSLTTSSRTEWQRRWQDDSTWRLGAGISSTAGVEWRVAGQLSLLAEYRASVQYTYGEADAHERTVRIRSEDGQRVSEDVDSEHSSPSFRNLTVGSQGAWLGISAYF